MKSSSSFEYLFHDKEDFKSFQNNQIKSLLCTMIFYVVIAGALILVWYTHAQRMGIASQIFNYLLSFVVIGWAQFSISHGMHEAVHKNLCNKKSDLWAAIISAYPIGMTMHYRDVHLLHHQHVGSDKDPDFAEYNTFPPSKIAMITRFFWYVSGIPAVKQFIELQKNDTKNKNIKIGELISFITVQALIFTVFFLIFNNLYFYFIFWCLPVVSIGKLCSSTRLLCEHCSPDKEWVIRSIDGPRWQTWTLGALDFNYHLEHHIVPSVPFAHLKRLHYRNKEALKSNPEYQPYKGQMEIFSGGYLSLLAKWFKQLPWVAR